MLKISQVLKILHFDSQVKMRTDLIEKKRKASFSKLGKFVGKRVMHKSLFSPWLVAEKGHAPLLLHCLTWQRRPHLCVMLLGFEAVASE